MLVLTLSAPPEVCSQKASGAGQKRRSNKAISMDFEQVDIKVFIKFISELTGRNFVVDDKVRGKVTVLSPDKISVEEAYKVFESVLEVHGFTTIPAGRVIKVVPSVAARQKSVETRRKPQFVSRPNDRVITQIVPLAYANAQEVRRLLAPLVSKQGVVIAYNPTDILIITDFQTNIQRLLQIVNEIDVEFREANITVLSLEYASAEKLAGNITNLLESKQKRVKGRTTAPPLKIVPYERINALIVLADRQNTGMIEGLIKTLDQPTPMGASNIQVVYLENAQSEELAKVLAGLPAKGQAKGRQPIISTEVKIVADKATNSLVITAKPEEFQVLEPIIKKLDIPRKQVFVEAVFMEVKLDTFLDIGVNWTVAGTTDIPGSSRSGVAFGASNPRTSPSLISQAAQLALPSGLTAGVISFPITIGDLTFNNLQALISASQTEDEFNIILTPQLMTLDNEEATVVVAENIPFSTRVDQGTAVTDRAIQSFEYKDVGVTLKITPQINEKRFVKLKVYEEVSRVVSESVTSGNQTILAPTTLKRTAETNIEVRDGQTVVVAGLIGDDIQESTAKVPCLGDVPILGWLFKAKTDETTRTNLLIFLTPHIVANPQEAEKIYQEKSKHMEDMRNDSTPESASSEKPSEIPAPTDGKP